MRLILIGGLVLMVAIIAAGVQETLRQHPRQKLPSTPGPAAPTPVGGPLVETLVVDEEKVSGDLPITLQSIDFIRNQTIVTAMAVPRGYVNTGELSKYGTSGMYRVDEGTWHELPRNASHETPEGVQLTWRLAPISSEVKVFEFRVTSFARLNTGVSNESTVLSVRPHAMPPA